MHQRCTANMYQWRAVKLTAGTRHGNRCPHTRGGEPRNLGTFTQKLSVSDQVWDHTLSNLRELAEARRIEVIELPSFGTNGDLSAEDAETLRRRVCKVLGRDLKT